MKIKGQIPLYLTQKKPMTKTGEKLWVAFVIVLVGFAYMTQGWGESFLLLLLLAFIPALIAKRKGYGEWFVAWWHYSFLLFPIALVHSLIVQPDRQAIQRTVEDEQLSSGMKKCPYCAEIIKSDANVCRYCSRDLVLNGTMNPNESLTENSTEKL